MQLENTFEVPASVEVVWAFMLDVEKVAPCMPGAELTEVVDDRTWKGKVNVKLGPMGLSYSGTVVLQERDDENHRGVLKASGTETRGKGTASSISTAWMEDAGQGKTRVFISTELTITGQVAQMGRGMIADVARRLTDEFGQCVTARIESSSVPGKASDAHPPAAPREVRGLRLGLWALGRAVARFVRRLLGRKRSERN